MIDTKKGSLFAVKCTDGAAGLRSLPDKSVKLIYGSPPYPNAERDYGVWRSDEYIEKITPFIDAAKEKLTDDGFLVINVKANREKATSKTSTKRSLVVEKLAILLEEKWGFSCVDIEIWVKDNPVPTGLRVACQDAYEQNLWFSKSPKWKIDLDAIRRPYEESSLRTYENTEFKPRTNGLSYVRKAKKIIPNPQGALPLNVIRGAVSSKQEQHQAVQPGYLPEKYIKACTKKGDLVVDPWLGTGTTGIAAISLERQFIGFDVSQQYVDHSESVLTKKQEEMLMKARVSSQRIEQHRLFLDALGESVVAHSEITHRPLEVEINKPFPLKLRVYLFTCSNPPGGRSPDEYKFNLNVPGQVGRGNFDTSDNAFIILAGYLADEDPDMDVWILWDASMHKNFAMNSNVQTKAELINNARFEKVATLQKNNGEIVVAARSKYLSEAIKVRNDITFKKLFGE